jgi:hypothetical protein
VKKKRWIILLIVAFPSLFWLILETSTINSRRLPFYGPKKAVAKGDTVYHRVSDTFYSLSKDNVISSEPVKLDESKFPLYAIVFIGEKYRKDSYRLAGMWEYLNYKKEKIEHIPFVLVTEWENGQSKAYSELQKLTSSKNVHFYTWNKTGFDSLVKNYFKEKPYYIDYSFFMLIDQNRHVRGYYDGRYVSEIKRLIEEYKHLRLKEEKQKLIETNEIKTDR